MRIMLRLTPRVMPLVVLAFALSGCAGPATSPTTAVTPPSAPATAPSTTPAPEAEPLPATTQQAQAEGFDFTLGISEARLTTDSHPHFGLTVTRDGKPADISPTAEVRTKAGTAPGTKLEVETNKPGDYDIHPDVHTAGAYQLVVTFKKPGGGTGQVTFPFTVEQGTGAAH